MSTPLQMPVKRLATNDLVLIDDREARVILTHNPMFTEGIEITYMTDLVRGVETKIVAEDALITVLDLGKEN
jgi:hypothetical protein